MVKCPFCRYTDDLSKFTLLRDPWKYRFYDVYYLKCPKCDGQFYYFTGIGRFGKHHEFTMRRKPIVIVRKKNLKLDIDPKELEWQRRVPRDLA